MLYITGIHALNLPCSLETCGDWHQSALQWERPELRESSCMPLKDWGIERNRSIPEHAEKYNVANTIRALLDLLYEKKFAAAQGMNLDFICNGKYDDIVFDKAYQMSQLKYWDKIDDFLGKEYGIKWLKYKNKKGENITYDVIDKKYQFANKRWREKHKKIIEMILHEINNISSEYILKGETALVECYGLNRFSEDIDFDSTDKETIFTIIEQFCKKNKFNMRIAKKTDTVSRFMIDYGGKNAQGSTPLKIEVSHRRMTIEESETTVVNGFKVYRIDVLAALKAAAYGKRDKLRDLYDVAYIVNNFLQELNPGNIHFIRATVAGKGLEQFGYLVETQADPLIDMDMLESEFLKMHENLGILNDREQEDGCGEEDNGELQQTRP